MQRERVVSMEENVDKASEFIDHIVDELSLTADYPEEPISQDFMLNAMVTFGIFTYNTWGELAPSVQAGITGAINALNGFYNYLWQKKQAAIEALHEGGIGAGPGE